MHTTDIERLFVILDDALTVIQIQSVMIKSILAVLEDNQLIDQKDWFQLLNYYAQE